jgi:hypothetical protein
MKADMADYSSHKVPDLKKILQERGLVISGNKADLIARLQEDDKKAGGSAGAGKHTPTHHLNARAFALTFPSYLLCSSLTGCRIHFGELGNANMFDLQQQVEQEKMKLTGTKTTNPPPSPQPQPSQQAAKAPYLRPSRYQTKKLP